MFTEWVVGVIRRLVPGFRNANARLVHPQRFFADALFAISVFFLLNRRILSSYRRSFWAQLLCLAQLVKVIYTLRIFLVELVFRELKTFFCVIGPVVSKLAIWKQWKAADPCVLRVVNLTFFLVFIGLNLLMAYGIESLARKVWRRIMDCRRGKHIIYYLPRPLVFCSPRRRRRQKSARYRIRGRSRSTSANKPFLAFWTTSKPAAAAAARPKAGTSWGSTETIVSSSQTQAARTTRSGRCY